MLWQFLTLLGIHWIGDFVLQTHWQASNKSKRNDALARHVGVYTAFLAIGSVLLIGLSQSWIIFVLLNGALHFVTDYITSRITSRLYAKADYHNFFVVIGFDQLIHQSTLAATLWLALRQ